MVGGVATIIVEVISASSAAAFLDIPFFMSELDHRLFQRPHLDAADIADVASYARR